MTISNETKRPFVAVIGLHSSGTSCLAGVLHHLGLYFGTRLGGYYGRNPNQSCGFEEAELRNICEQTIPFFETGYRLRNVQTYWMLRDWVRQIRHQAAEQGKIAAAKYPLLCQLGKPLVATCGDDLRLIVSQRPIEESIESLKRREQKRTPSRLARHQQWLEEGKQQLINMVGRNRVLEVSYHDLLWHTDEQLERIAAFLDLKPTPRQQEFAARWVDPAKRHVFAGINA